MELKEIVALLKDKDVLECVMCYHNGKWQAHSNFLDSNLIINLESPQNATCNSITFLEKDQYIEEIKTTKAKAVLTRKEHLNVIPTSAFALVCESPYLGMAYLTECFAAPLFNSATPPKIAKSAQIASNVAIGNGSEIGENCVILANVSIGENVKIGSNCVLFPGVCIYNHCELGDNVRIHANSVIGSDGFGYAHTKDGRHIKIYHNGKAVLENDVEIGANTTIDRAVFGETRIKQGTKIDNLVQIAHNCNIGEFSIIVSQAGISGSTSTGRNVVLGGQCGSAGHLHIGDFTQVGARGAISKSLPANGKFSGHPLLPLNDWLKLQALLKKMLKKT
ncbi:UDP-3-O-(3-hydroxymyristoyl)glucosamine N-acyltransferase [Helicobacter sp.]|uniref:UDP-3-O-(3-hydroxymyristoyl)glucosamine N-acyltransferase n=1 Tax=Helicobacter sp. TaxID=218 RepID=UPI0025BEFD7F|nr:UDP-3-O-(3-hydroxymyristoyl)glucosamine N-acyltransferase [Helicobacter sp.]MCI5968838.1 UDP-3-O-(3-hydroxymyristoyl)glucosamine N-acyltransferase [Helicobacter sp.]MDY2585023.1 UDP-3-O-(3-hydroxymyristoyl)glucosamine N-acyltransferase [Helicobacter sp.]